MIDIPSAALDEQRLRLIVNSYLQLTGRSLLDIEPDNSRELALALWEAPFAIVAHGTEDDPVFFYGNCFALKCFEMCFSDFTRLPSRLSAEALAQGERSRLLQRVSEHGYIDNYAGMRIAKSGNRFMISNGSIWNLIDKSGAYHGQAATFVV